MHAVAPLLETLCYKPDGRAFDFPMVSLEFFTEIFLPATL